MQRVGGSIMNGCPCGSNLDYSGCCEQYIIGQGVVPTAEALMRSRYSAYVKNSIEYIEKTHHPDGREDFDLKASSDWANQAEWKGLEIKAVRKGKEDDDEGVVEFIAKYEMKGDECSHHEIARFKKAENTWFYLDGNIIMGTPVVREEPKIGRNDPCPCGSGKKHKKCCLGK